jgi:hypothetical protein
MSSFEDILNRNSDEISAPPVLPPGPYHTIVTGLPERGESAQKKTPSLTFKHRIVAPLEGVDEEAMSQIEGGVIGKEIKNTFYITENSAFMLKDFLTNCGIDLDGKSLGAAIDEVPNREVIIFIKHDMVGDGDQARAIAKVGKTAPVE